MIIDEKILNDGLDDVILHKLIARHMLEGERYEQLRN